MKIAINSTKPVQVKAKDASPLVPVHLTLHQPFVLQPKLLTKEVFVFGIRLTVDH